MTMTAAQAVTATFTTVQRTLTVTKAGTGSGTVTSVPGGIACGNDCTGGYANGTAVTLTAVAMQARRFRLERRRLYGHGLLYRDHDGRTGGDRHVYDRATDIDGHEGRDGQWDGDQCARGHRLRERLYGGLCQWDGGDADGGGECRLDVYELERRRLYGHGLLYRDHDGRTGGDRHVYDRATDIDGHEGRDGQWDGDQCARGHRLRERLYGGLCQWDGGDADGGGECRLDVYQAGAEAAVRARALVS